MPRYSKPSPAMKAKMAQRAEMRKATVKKVAGKVKSMMKTPGKAVVVMVKGKRK